MGLFDGCLICSDIDGTLAVQGEVSSRNLEAIARFQAEGGIFTLATGRYAGYSDRLPVRPNGPIITENGARIYDPQLGRTLWAYPLDGSGMLLDWIDARLPQKVSLRFTDGVQWVSGGQVVETFLSHTTGELLQIICCGFASGADAVAFRDDARNRFGGRYDIRRSWDVGVEFVSPLGGKGNCLRQLKQILGDSVTTVIAIGDYENDYEMLRAADRSFTPSNACAEILATADTVLCSCEEGAVGALIETLEKETEREL